MGGVRGTWLVLCYDLDFLLYHDGFNTSAAGFCKFNQTAEKKHDTISSYLGSMLVLGMFDQKRGLWPELAFPKTHRSRGTSPAPLFSHKMVLCHCARKHAAGSCRPIAGKGPSIGDLPFQVR